MSLAAAVLWVECDTQVYLEVLGRPKGASGRPKGVSDRWELCVLGVDAFFEETGEVLEEVWRMAVFGEVLVTGKVLNEDCGRGDVVEEEEEEACR